MNKNSKLTQFNTGGSHSENKLGGIPLTNNASVEENETKSGNFIYSDRIILDDNIVSQYNLPKSLIGKSVADATKFVDNKFKGRNDKISQSTKDSMLSKIAEAQESMKPQEPEMEEMINPSQMANGGEMDDTEFDPSGIISSVPGLMNLGKDLFGKSNIQSDPNNIQDLAPVKMGNEISGGAVKGLSTGAQFGSSFGPLGTGIGAGVGALVGSIGGLIGGNKKERAINRVNNKNAYLANSQYSDQYAMGGSLIDPPIKTEMVNDNQPWQTKKIVKYQPGVTGSKNGDSGFYLYSKDNTDPTFNYKTDREFVKNSAMGDLQKTAQWQDYMRNKNVNPNSNINLNFNNPITEEYAYGGKMKTYADGGYYENLKLTPRNTAPIESQLDLNGLQAATTTVPYTIGTQPIVDVSNANRTLTPGPSTLDMLKFNAGKVGNYVNQNAGNLTRYAPIAANALQLANLKKPQGERLDRLTNRYKPEYVDEAALQNIVNQTMNNSINAVSQSGASQGQTRASIIGSQLQRSKALSDAYANAAAQNRATNDRAQTFNLGVDQVNLNQSNTEKENDARNIGNYDTQKSRLIGQLGNDIGNVGKEEIYKKIAKTTTGYSWLGEYQKMNPDATPEEVEKAAKKAGVLTDSTTKKALGGYLLKNKGK